MNIFNTLFFLLFIQFYVDAQITDTCQYVDQNNHIGGLDCAMGSLAQFTADTYQWVYCDSSYAPIPGETNSWYGGTSAVNIALVITYLGCIDTSYCQYACSWGLEELHSNKVALIKILDSMGRETEDKPNILLFYLYSDGTTEKVFRLAD